MAFICSGVVLGSDCTNSACVTGNSNHLGVPSVYQVGRLVIAIV